MSEAWETGGHEAATGAVPDELGVAGTPDEARDQFRDAVGTLVVDRPIVYVPRSVSGATRDWTIETLAPEQLRARSL